MFKKHDLKRNLDKTEVMRFGKQRDELNIMLVGNDIKQVNKCVYLGGNISENGLVEVEMQNRIQAGANAVGKVEGIMMDIHIFRTLKGKVLDFCVVQLLTLSEQQRHRGLHVCVNNWISKIAGVKRVEGMIMKDLREEVGT